MNHFERFGLPTAFGLDLKVLEAKFRDLSLQHHPDRQTSADPHQRRLAVEETAQLNDGFRILKDPIRRATYLLKLRGVDLEREEASHQRSLPLEFLEEVMSLREELDLAREANDLEKARSMGKEVETRRDLALRQAVGELEKNSPEATSQAAEQLIAVRYFSRFLEEVESIEEEGE